QGDPEKGKPGSKSWFEHPSTPFRSHFLLVFRHTGFFPLFAHNFHRLFAYIRVNDCQINKGKCGSHYSSDTSHLCTCTETLTKCHGTTQIAVACFFNAGENRKECHANNYNL